MTTELTERAVRFIDTHKSNPFFLYLAHPQPHVPLFVSDKHAGKTERGLFGDVITEIDWSMGQILKRLDHHGISENTMVIFTSDNGPWLSYGTHAGDTAGLREGKGTSWEGGVREPFVMKWPKKIPAGTVCNEPAMTIDLLPTIADLLDVPRPKRKIDGKNIWPLMNGTPGAKSPHDAYFWYYRGNDLEAMRMGDWKLQFPHRYRSMEGRPGGTDGTPNRYNNQVACGLELYNLKTDRGETTDVAAKHPEIVKQMQALANAKRAELGDSLKKQKGSERREPGRVARKK